MDHKTYCIRHFTDSDIATIGAVMATAEGYTLTGPAPFALDEINATLAGYLNHPRRFGHVVVGKDNDDPIGFYLQKSATG